MSLNPRYLLNLSTADDDGAVVAYTPGAASDLRLTGALTDFDDDGIGLSQTPAAGGTQSFTLAGAISSGGIGWILANLGASRRVTFTGTGNESGRTFTISGINEAGNAVTEAVTGFNNATVASVARFQKITGITTDGNTAGAVKIGFEGNMTLDTNGNARRVRVTVNADESAKSVTIYGTNKWGRSISETLTLPSSATTGDSVYDYKTVTRVSVSAALTSTIKVGTGPIASTPWIPLDRYRGNSIALMCILSSGASLTYKVQHTDYDVQFAHEVPTIEVFDHASITGKTANSDGNYDFCPRACRLTLTAFTSGTVTLGVNQGTR